MSKQRNFRGRSKLSFEEEEEDGTPQIKAPAQAKASKPQPSAASASVPKVNSKSSLLSFDEDDGSAAGSVQPSKKKDKQKSKIGRAQGLPELPAVSAVSTQQSAAGEYTAARLQELKSNALSFNTAKFNTDGSTAQQPIVKLSGSFKPAGAPKDDRFTINPPGMDVIKPPAQPGVKEPSPPPPAASHIPAQPVVPVVPVSQPDDEEEEEDDTMDIPNEEMIRLAKAKRERLRAAHLAPDYIPLGGVSKLLASSKTGGGSGGGAGGGDVVEAGSGSDAEGELEDHMRIKFSVTGADRHAEKKGYAKTINATAVDDEDVADFEAEQLRKAVRRNKAAMPQTAVPPSEATANQQQYQQYHPRYGYDGSYVAGPVGYGTGRAAAEVAASMAGPLTKSRLENIAQAGASAIASLRDGVARLTTSHKTAQSNFTKISSQLSQSTEKVNALEQQTKAASDKYIYMQQLRAYIADLLDCLSDKAAIVEELEESLAELREERAAATQGAVRLLEEEMLRPAHAAVSAALGVLGRQGALPAAQKAAENAAADEDDKVIDEAAGPEEIDEFGRNVDAGRRREALDRRKQRTELMSRELVRLKAVAAGAAITLSDDSWQVESEAQVLRYIGRHKDIMTAGATVFADAAEEFASLEAVKQRLEEFKARYPKDYANTYMHLSCPALFAPFVRLELLKWDPLFTDAAVARNNTSTTPSTTAGLGSDAQQQTVNGHITHGPGDEGVRVNTSFETLSWYDSLFHYGASEPGGVVADDDPDADLVPQLVRKIVLPVALHMLRKCWDPFAVQQSVAAAKVVEEMLIYVPAHEPAMVELLDSVCDGLNQAVGRVTMPAWPPAALPACPMAEAVLSLRFQAGVKLLKALSCWISLLSQNLLQTLALEKVLNQQMMPYLRSAATAMVTQSHTAVARLEAVATALPAQWFVGGSPPTAAAFIELLKDTAVTLEQAPRAQKTTLETAARRLLPALKRLGEEQRATRLAAAYGIQ